VAGEVGVPSGAVVSDEAPAATLPDTEAPAGAASPPGAPKQAPERETGRRKPRFPTLVRAFRNGTPVPGTVQSVIKGGYEVRVGRARGFCPHSQIELHREDNPEAHVARTYEFRIVQLRRGGEDLVLSRRVLLEEQRREEAKAVRATLLEGAVMQGRVAGTASFGAFVDLGAGVMGLAHVSELAHRRVQRVEDAVQLGDVVQVKILKIHPDTGKISLSLRAAQKDPWQDVAQGFQVGGTYPGKVVRLADFGAFVELAPGVEGLAPASEMPPRPGGWREGIEPGAVRDWQVLSVDPAERRISVTLPGTQGVAATIEERALVPGRVQRIERYGVFVWLAPGRVGLMPRNWTGTPPGSDLAREFGIGDEVEVLIVEILDAGRKIRLARKGVDPAAPPAEETTAPRPRARRAPPKREESPPPEQPGGSFGTTLADKLRAALEDRDSGTR
jgi:small subunit ribosomal protein S1